ncbi:hypothetical protein, partial [Treponema sp. R8-4-B8]
MKNLQKMWVLVLIVGLVFGLVGCSEDDDKKTGNDIDYTNYASPDYSIQVKNDSNKKLVAFLGEPNSENLISGIPTGGSVHGLKKDPRLFPNTSSFDFVLFLVTEEDYLANKDNLSSLKNKPFTRLYAYHNKNSSNANVYRISGILGGTKRIILQNATNYNVELRDDSEEYGRTIGYTTRQTYNTTFYVDADDYMVFPVFRKFSDALGEIVSGYPVFQEDGPLKGKAYFTEFSLHSTDEVTINALDFVSGIKVQAGAAFLIIQNNSGVGISLWDGITRQTTESGGQVINPNDSMIFPIYAARVQQTFIPYIQKGQFKIGTSATQHIIPLPTDSYTDGANINVSNVYLEGKIYTINVTGTNANTLAFSPVTRTGDWDWQE